MNTAKPIVKNPEMVFLSIPKEPLLRRSLTWKETINNSYNENLSLGNTIHIYYQNIIDDLKSYTEKLKQNEKVKEVDLIAKASFLGYPNQLYIKYVTENNEIDIYYDGIIILFRQKLPFDVFYLEDIEKHTDSNLQFRNLCLLISKEIQIEIRWIPDPFYIGCFDNLKDFGFETDADYPGLKITYSDNSFATITNYGDIQKGKIGYEYNFYLANEKNRILERLSIDRLILHDLNILLKETDDTNKYLIEANERIINSLKNMPSSILNIVERYSNWLKLKHIPNNILSIDASLPKQNLYLSLFDEFLARNSSYVIVPSVIYFDEDKLKINAREISHFFQLRYKSNTIELIDSKGIIPGYAFLIPEIRKSFNRVSKSMLIAKKNLNDSISIYSSNFGYDAIIIAIASVIIQMLPFSIICNITYYLIKPILKIIRSMVN